MRARKVDNGQAEIVKAYEALGCRVWLINAEADFAVQLGKVWDVVEYRPPKSGVKGPRKGRQERFHQKFSVQWVRTVDDVLAHVKRIREWKFAIDRQEREQFYQLMLKPRGGDSSVHLTEKYWE